MAVNLKFLLTRIKTHKHSGKVPIEHILASCCYCGEVRKSRIEAYAHNSCLKISQGTRGKRPQFSTLISRYAFLYAKSEKKSCVCCGKGYRSYYFSGTISLFCSSCHIEGNYTEFFNKVVKNTKKVKKILKKMGGELL